MIHALSRAMGVYMQVSICMSWLDILGKYLLLRLYILFILPYQIDIITFYTYAILIYLYIYYIHIYLYYNTIYIYTYTIYYIHIYFILYTYIFILYTIFIYTCTIYIYSYIYTIHDSAVLEIICFNLLPVRARQQISTLMSILFSLGLLYMKTRRVTHDIVQNL